MSHEALVVVRRGPEVPVVHRVPDDGGYWHVVAGGVEPGEADADAARREPEEGTGLVAALRPRPTPSPTATSRSPASAPMLRPAGSPS